jgi:F-type H+-transporting ATPase subunit epsilon
MHLKVITPERITFDNSVNSVYLDTEIGQIGILPHHADFVTKVKPGALRISVGGKDTVMVTGEGLLQMQADTVTILTDLAEESSDIDEKSAEEARKRAQEALTQKLSDEEYAETFAILERSLAKLKVKRRHR